MANIKTYLAKILSATYGEEVRGSIHDAIEAMNIESENAMSYAATAKESAVNSANAAAASASSAEDSASSAASANTSALSAKTTAETYMNNAQTYMNNAQTYMNNAKTSETNTANLERSVGEQVEDVVRMRDDLVSDVNHRNIYRGKNLGTSVSSEQKAAIQSGSFDDLFIGDYWVINGVTWVIADMDYFYNCGDTAFTKHHLVIVPNGSLYNAQMNESNVTTGGYVGSKMYTENLNSAKETISAAFGDMVLSHKEYLTNAVTNGQPSAGGWFDSTVELMNEIMVFGTHVYVPANNGVKIPTRYTVAKQQLALFALNPRAINIRQYIWLRDVVSAGGFADVDVLGLAASTGASNSVGVRPEFCIG